jgi:gliding motility-associated-like protein
VGGKITYRYLGSNKYEITLSVYRDCSVTTPFDTPAFISIFDKASNNLVYNQGLSLASQSIIPASLPNPCFAPPPGICLEIGNYIDTVNLAPNALGYSVVYQRCCRNITVQNIVLPNQNGTTITVDIPPQTNSTPKFNNFPPLFICFSDTFKYSFSATDIDGDVLKYNLCNPLLGASFATNQPNPASPPPFLPVSWTSTFTASNPMPSSGGITLDPNTGQFKFKPSMLGQFAICVCVEEYRNNQLINTNRLELQFNIVNCYLTSSIPTATNLCEGLTIPFQNSSTNANSFHWNFGDLTTNADTSNLYTPTYTFPSYGTYTVSLTVYNTAYGTCKDSSKKVINVHPLLSPTMQTTYKSCFKNNNFNFSVGGSFDPSASFNWNFTPNSLSPNTAINPTSSHFTTPSTKTVSVIVNQFGCKDTLIATVTFSNPIASINGNLNCNEKNLNFGNFSTNASLFHWDFGETFSSIDTSSLVNPIYSYSAYGVYTVSLIAYDGSCSDTMKLPIRVFPKLELFPDTIIQQQCFTNNSFNFFANGIYGSGATFNWLLGTNSSFTTSSVENPNSIHFTAPGTYPIRLIISENGCTKQRTGAIKVFPSPDANVLLSDSVGCAPLSIKFKSIIDSLHPVTNYWNIHDSLFVDTAVYYHFADPGSYSYSLIVKDANNCTDTVKQNINIYPKPIAKGSAYPVNTNILYPQINFVDSTSGNHTTYFYFGDGSSSNDVNVQYSYQSEGDFIYNLIVMNEYGCTDTIQGSIVIDGIASNYVPNIFTPNGDGVNERFYIKGKSIVSSSMFIYNRWGSLVCESSNALEGWNGLDKDTGEPCSVGTFFYVIKITLENTKNYTFNGTVQLQR